MNSLFSCVFPCFFRDFYFRGSVGIKVFWSVFLALFQENKERKDRVCLLKGEVSCWSIVWSGSE